MELLANPIVSQFIGLLVGLFTSFFSWWVLFRWMAPTISISSSISRTPSSVSLEDDDDKSGARYRIKIENSGHRPAVDLQVSVFVRVKGLNDPQSTIWEIIHLPLATSGETGDCQASCRLNDYIHAAILCSKSPFFCSFLMC